MTRARPARAVLPAATFVLIRGPLGIGKTTVAKQLAQSIGAEYISIDAILEEHDLEQWGEVYITEESFLRTNDFVAERALPRLKAGTSVVVDGNFYWESQVPDLTRRIPHPSWVFTLQAPVELCIYRDAHRERPLGEEAARLVFAKVVSFDCGIPVDATPPLPKIVASLRSQIQRRVGARPRRPTSSAVRGSRPRG